MEIMLITFVVLLVIIVAMSVGVLLGRKPIAGSCGGMASLGMETACDICGGSKAKCEKEQRKQKQGATAEQMTRDMAELGYEVKSNS